MFHPRQLSNVCAHQTFLPILALKFEKNRKSQTPLEKESKNDNGKKLATVLNKLKLKYCSFEIFLLDCYTNKNCPATFMVFLVPSELPRAFWSTAHFRTHLRAISRPNCVGNVATEKFSKHPPPVCRVAFTLRSHDLLLLHR